jgi:hypothetical protein
VSAFARKINGAFESQNLGARGRKRSEEAKKNLKIFKHSFAKKSATFKKNSARWKVFLDD